MRNRATKIEKDRRIFEIQGWLIQGVQDYIILKNIEQKYGVGRRQSKYLLEEAYKEIRENQVDDIEQKRILRIAELKQDIRNMKEEYKGTPRGMAVVNSIKKEITKLEGLYPARKISLEGDAEKPIIISSVEEHKKRKEELIAKLLAKKSV